MSILFRGVALAIGVGLSTSACAQPSRIPMTVASTPATLVSQPPFAAAPPRMPDDVIRPEGLPHPHAAAADSPEVGALRASMASALGATLQPESPAQTVAALAAARAMMDRRHVAIDAPQVVLVVDRSPSVQRLWLTVAQPGGALEPLGMVKVSTGKPGRLYHFRTPVGAFDNDSGILGYRAQGTYNENHIRGIGAAGMRVWDFGWQTTDDWRFHDRTGTMAVRMEMHATDPAVLEPRLGRWDSEGCIRIPSRFNSFLDHSGLIDAKLREAAVGGDRRFAALLPRNTQPNPLAGHILVIVDTSDPAAPPSDPVRAASLGHGSTHAPEHDDAS